MVVVNLLISIGEEQQSIGSGDAPPQIPDGVQCRLISPLRVLDHQHRGPHRPRQQLQQRFKQGRAITIGERLVDAGFGAGDVVERTQRLRGNQVVAEPGENVRRIVMALDEFLDQRGLADTGFAADQDDLAPRITRPGQQIGQLLNLSISLEKHPPNIPKPTLTRPQRGKPAPEGGLPCSWNSQRCLSLRP